MKYYAVVYKSNNKLIHDGFGAKIFTDKKDAELGHRPSDNVKIVECEVKLFIN